MGERAVQDDLDLGGDGFLRNVRAVCNRLDAAYEETDLGNKSDPFEELVYVVLSTRTREAFYQAAFERVKAAVKGDWNRLLEVRTDL